MADNYTSRDRRFDRNLFPNLLFAGNEKSGKNNRNGRSVTCQFVFNSKQREAVILGVFGASKNRFVETWKKKINMAFMIECNF